MNPEKAAAIQAACAAERERERAAAAEAQSAKAAPCVPADPAPLLTVQEAISAIERVGLELSAQRYDLEQKLDQVLQGLEALRAHAVPIGVLEPLGLTGDEALLEPPAALAAAAAEPSAPVDRAPESD